MMRKPIILFGLLTISVLLYMILVSLADLRNQIEYYLLIVSVLFTIYMIFVFLTLRGKNILPLHWAWLIIFALLPRLVLLQSPPTFFHDVNRYIWSEDTILIVKIILIVLETILAFLLIKILRHFSLSAHRLIIFLYNPLLIIETYYNGHLEIIWIMFFWSAIFFFYKQKDPFAFAGITLSVIVKPFSLIMAMPILFKRFWRKFILLIFICIVILIFFNMYDKIPLTGFLSVPKPGVFHGAIFKVITYILNLINLPVGEMVIGSWVAFYVDSNIYYIVLMIFGIIVIALDQMRKLKVTSKYRSINYLQASFILTGTGMLLLPHLPPWYLIAIIPFLLFVPNWSWLVFTFLIQLSYYLLKEYAIRGTWQESSWILLLIYTPFYGLLIWEYLDRRQIKGWFLNHYSNG